MPDLAVLVPSRGRPDNIARLRDQMTLRSRADTQLVVGVDADDPHVEDYVDTLAGTDHRLVVHDGLRGYLVGWLNLLAAEHTDNAPFIGHIGDDNEIQTDGWDERICDSLSRQDGVRFCFGNDHDPGRAPGSLSIHIFMTVLVVKRLGYMGPPSLRHMYVDPTWYAWGKRTSIEFLADVSLPHQHYSLGRSAHDASYEASTALIPDDCAAYNAYCQTDMNADIAKLGGVPFDPVELANFNAELNIPKEWPR